MNYIADLHIHSHFSRSTSKHCNLFELKKWATIKGINLLGTGDFTHPLWLKELKENLEPDGQGFFKLKKEGNEGTLPYLKTDSLCFRYCLQTEISSIFKKNEKTRKVHSIIFVPDFESAERFNARLTSLGANISSDGRPILGLSPKNLLEILLEISPECYLIPAHIWTPWFSLFGSKSGFDSIAECFEDLTEYIFALETGLSSDPAMNWQVSSLDPYTLISNSDAHSPQKLGREANLFATDFSYSSMFKALKTKKDFLGTIEFFPQEGKYHFDGHRKCGICFNPEQTKKVKGICPECGKTLTIGVMHRVLELADREMGIKPKQQKDFKYLIPLQEILSQILGKGPGTKTIREAYLKIINSFGNEFSLLFDVPIEDIKRKAGHIIATAIKKLRRREVNSQPGFDGEFGVIKVFDDYELEKLQGQAHLFNIPVPKNKNQLYKQKSLFDSPETEIKHITVSTRPEIEKLDKEQERIINTTRGALVVTAGPGTGKTRVLTSWIANLIEKNICQAQNILAITFTNKAAREVTNRLELILGQKMQDITISTFHAFCFQIIKDNFPAVKNIYDQGGRISILRYLYPQLKEREIMNLCGEIERYLSASLFKVADNVQEMALKYQEELKKIRCVDLAALISEVNLIFEIQTTILDKYRRRYKYIAVDEFQDINPAQYQLLCYLIGPKSSEPQGFKKLSSKGILVIGDPDQAIYGFRGGDLRLFFRFQNDFQAKYFTLSKNYRSYAQIIEAARILIANNSLKSGLILKPTKSKTEKIIVIPCSDETEEAKYIVSTIKNLVGGTDFITSESPDHHDKNIYSFKDIAVLTRTHAVATKIISALKREGIPISLKSQESLFNSPPHSYLADFLRYLTNRQDYIAYRNILNFMLPDLELSELEQAVLALKQAQGHINKMFTNKFLNKNISSAHLKQLFEAYNFLEFVEVTIENQGVHKGIFILLERISRDIAPDPQIAAHNQAIAEIAREHSGDLSGLMKHLFLCTFESQSPLNPEKVQVLTFHAAKGLEFPIVIIAAAEEGITPIIKKDTDLEEERRLFYVALTRAKERLYITYAHKRKIYGNQVEEQSSRFIKEIPESLKKIITSKKKKDSFKQELLF